MPAQGAAGDVNPCRPSREAIRRLVVVLMAALIIVPLFLKGRESRKKPAPAAFSVPVSGILVSIRGDVRHPGFYTVDVNSMTASVIKMAIPYKAEKSWLPAGIEDRPVANGDEITVLFNRDGIAELAVKPVPAASRMVMGIPLEINRMTADDFDRLPGVGLSLAKRIVQYRQLNGGFMVVQDLLQVEGIGHKKYSEIKKFF